MADTQVLLHFDRFVDKFSKAELIDIYKKILLPRLIEEKMLILLRQGRISKWFSGWGQEAISVGVAYAMESDEYLLPMHRNLGLFTTRGIPLHRLFAQFQGKPLGFTKGRDRSFHFGSKEHRIVGMISHLGPQMGIADGIALGNVLKDNKKVVAVFTGDGGASEGDFHESVNVAAVWNLPVIFVIENNQWGLSTPSNEQFRCARFSDKGIGYGIEAETIDGNNILEVIDAVRYWRQKLSQGSGPVLLECITFRMRGHEEASGTKYYPPGIQDEWAKKDPVAQYEHFLLEEGVLTEELVNEIRSEIKARINEELEVAFSAPNATFDREKELADVYAPFDYKITQPKGASREMRLLDAITDAMDQAMQRHPNLILMGQDIAEYGGVFKATEGFVHKYGKARVRNTPLCESAIIGAGLGLSINGFKAMVEMQFADFVTEGFTQIVNNLAKIHYRWGQNADVVVRMPTGAGVAAGPFHSQSNESWFAHVPGLKIVYPAFPADAKGLLLTAFEDPNPVMFFEHKALYRSVTGQVPEGYYTLPFGQANVVSEGKDLTLVTYGFGVHWALEYQKNHPEFSIEIIDLRTLIPLDEETIYQSVKKTGRALVLYEDTYTGAFGAEIGARIAEVCFRWLDAPVGRVGSLDTPVPFNSVLEEGFLAKSQMDEAIRRVLEF
ncbi:dehydrogenase [Thermaurantimonas aggregans]|uniref:Dehydrogenase n=1 Tax=Thermaurantimonas aggregans TaxID=2173829 RepID=A0A401XJD0_9FLAO|nr:dehydrogenase E1 component subunit alpha/beta [Thermaurantimonas aggregans]MCX8148683.1 dehydrogenase E1 component subunit alpha/beta [Thermaurantimonas aggregans]GCD77147.1 dehydrogenase [Thermaurantimonas aggregans]